MISGHPMGILSVYNRLKKTNGLMKHDETICCSYSTHVFDGFHVCFAGAACCTSFKWGWMLLAGRSAVQWEYCPWLCNLMSCDHCNAEAPP